MQKLRSLHLYLGCIFAPMLLFFAISGIWQALKLDKNHTGVLAALSTIHKLSHPKTGISLSSPVLVIFVLLMAASFIITTVLGVVLAVKMGKSRKAAYACLVVGVIFPFILVLLQAMK